MFSKPVLVTAQYGPSGIPRLLLSHDATVMRGRDGNTQR